jgi:hypothetical protein
MVSLPLNPKNPSTRQMETSGIFFMEELENFGNPGKCQFFHFLPVSANASSYKIYQGRD